MIETIKIKLSDICMYSHLTVINKLNYNIIEWHSLSNRNTLYMSQSIFKQAKLSLSDLRTFPFPSKAFPYQGFSLLQTFPTKTFSHRGIFMSDITSDIMADYYARCHVLLGNSLGREIFW